MVPRLRTITRQDKTRIYLYWLKHFSELIAKDKKVLHNIRSRKLKMPLILYKRLAETIRLLVRD